MQYCHYVESSSPSYFVNLTARNSSSSYSYGEVVIFSPTGLNNANFLILTLVKLCRNNSALIYVTKLEHTF